MAVRVDYPVGSLVRFRERDWVVLPSDDPDVLWLRPLQGREDETCGVYLPFEGHLLEPATFPLPDPDQAGDFVGGRLLRDAARLALRSGAGPFRCMGKISVRPRPYQLVPLIMALRLDPVRLLIADDVGVGKTIEAGLIARELLERGDAQRLCVLCPPHLADQWQRELAEKFHIEAVIVRSSTISQLERNLPPGTETVYHYYPHLIVSIDFAKGEHQRPAFVAGCPDLVIVDEVHGAARPPEHSARAVQQQRYTLLRELSRDRRRHLILLTATPHSGIQESFASLLGLLDPALEPLVLGQMTRQDRERVARHFVQRRRADVERWLGHETPFPKRDPYEITYTLAADYLALFEDILAFARETVQEPGLAKHRQRMRYWAALALLRCVMSSPGAAVEALSRREGGDGTPVAAEEEDLEALRRREVLDVITEEAVHDTVPEGALAAGARDLGRSTADRLRAFRRRAEALLASGKDPKLDRLVREVRSLLRDGFHPIVYCRFIATARYVAEEIRRRLGPEFPTLHVAAVTGEMNDEERAAQVAELGLSPRRVLVATDCLSEGIDLQRSFNAVIHYDLPWNPNRLEQREGRVDRYGQPSPVVRVALLYGENNEIDLAVLDVLIKKARQIQDSLGITVPVPVDNESLVEAVIRAVLERTGRARQLRLDIDIDQVHREWDRAAVREKESRTLFAQHAIKPEEVARELEETDEVLGDPEAVRRFVLAAAERLGLPISRDGARVLADPTRLPPLPWRPRARGPIPVAFDGPAPEGVEVLGRNHPWVAWMAGHVLGLALAPEGSPLVARAGALYTQAVDRRTGIVLLRLRYRLLQRGRSDLFAEEVAVAAFRRGTGGYIWTAPNDPEVLRWLHEVEPCANISPEERREQVVWALEVLRANTEPLQSIAHARAARVAEAHNRLRSLVGGGRVHAEPYLPDVIGLYVLLPGVSRR